MSCHWSPYPQLHQSGAREAGSDHRRRSRKTHVGCLGSEDPWLVCHLPPWLNTGSHVGGSIGLTAQLVAPCAAWSVSFRATIQAISVVTLATEFFSHAISACKFSVALVIVVVDRGFLDEADLVCAWDLSFLDDVKSGSQIMRQTLLARNLRSSCNARGSSLVRPSETFASL